ncbi:MAG: ATP-binding protein [Candidatus Nanoarchaeia archaeon]|nr:ATP-binding protein [Candidatus Nanoarchaeia archaeon]
MNKAPIIIGRKTSDYDKFGLKGAVLLGKKYIEEDNKYILADDVYLDLATAHVMFICGKRGGGKSYTMGVIAEGFSLLTEDVKQNLAIILLDTMGVYWTMKHPNKRQRELLESYGLRPDSVNVKIYTPRKYYFEYKQKGIPTDVPFSIKASQLTGEDWCEAFKLDKYSLSGIFIQDLVSNLREKKEDYLLEDLIDEIKNIDFDLNIKLSVKQMFKVAQSWGVFFKDATDFDELATGGQVSVLDVSCYATMPGGWDVKSLVVGMVAKHLFNSRMQSRKEEEHQEIVHKEEFFNQDNENYEKQEMPLVWLVIDEAHEFLPKDEKLKSVATDPLVIIMREGRQPGISLILATQQPGKIHTDVMTQSDIVLSHRITARIDVDALSLLAQSYMEDGIMKAIDFLPKENGAAVCFDDKNEYLFQLKVRPRISWHGGESPIAIKKGKND